MRTGLLPSLTVALACLLATASLGCKDEPDRSWAQETAPTFKPAMDDVVQSLTPLLATFAPKPFDAYPEASRDEALKAEMERKAAFDAAAMQVMAKHPAIIGWEASYSYPDHDKVPIPYSFEDFSRQQPSYKASTTVRAGTRDVKLDPYKLGWGTYQVRGHETYKSLGFTVSQYFKGVEFATAIKHDQAQLDLKVFFVDPGLYQEK